MEELLAEMERCLDVIYDRDKEINLTTRKGAYYPSSYQSFIKISGKPILPPLMTEARRIEMRKYKEAAKKREIEILSMKIARSKIVFQHHPPTHDKQTRLRSGYQISSTPSIGMKSPEDEYNQLVTDRAISTGEIFMDLSVNFPANSHQTYDTPEIIPKEGEMKLSEDENSEPFLKELTSTGDKMDKMFVDLSIELPDNSLPSDQTEQGRNEGFNDKIVEGVRQDMKAAGLMDSLPSTASSSDISTLNQTVINLSDLPEEIKNSEQNNKVENSSGDGNQQPEDGIVKYEDEHLSKMNLLQKNDSKLDVLPSLRQSFSDSESFISFVGEYNKLPTPTPSSSTPEISDTSGARLDMDEVWQSPPLEPSVSPSVTIEGNVDVKSSPTDDIFMDGISPGSLHYTSGSLGIMETNVSSLGSLGKSCTLPISVTESCNSTLADISERLDIEEIPMDTPDPMYPSKQEPRNKDPPGSGTDSTIPSTLRRGPVGQEADNFYNDDSEVEREQDLEKETRNVKSLSTGEGGRVVQQKDGFSSPVCRVRRNSYTLEIPSPALLDAKARNEAPYAVSIDFEGEVVKESAIWSDGGRQQESVFSDAGIDEVALVSQLELLEEIKRRLEMEQKQQLQELLERQKREQWLLQKEMTDVQERVTASRTSDVSKKDHSGSSDDPIQDMEMGSEVTRGPKWSPPIVSNVVALNEHPSSETTSIQDSLEKPPCQNSSVTNNTSMATRGYHHKTKEQVNQHRGPEINLDSYTKGHTRVVSSPMKDQEHPPLASFGGSRGSIVQGQSMTSGVLNGFYLEDWGYEKADESELLPTNKQDYSTYCDAHFDKISAAAKGFLTRRLLSTIRVQEIVKTVKDSSAFIFKLQMETPIKGGNISTQDTVLAGRILNQLRAAKFELYDMFHSLSPASRMNILQQDREAKKQLPKRKSLTSDEVPSRPLSAATKKAMERRKLAKEAEKKVVASEQGPKGSNIGTQSRAPSAPHSRILKQLQGHEAPTFPTRPISSAAYRSNRNYANHNPVRITASSKAHCKKETEPNTQIERTKSSASIAQRNTIPQSNVRRVLYPATSAKKIIRKQAPRKPFKP